MTADQGHEDARAARLFHTLSSFGWFREPVIAAVPPAEPSQPLPADPQALESLAALLAARTSQRTYTGGTLSKDELLALAWCGYGRTSAPGPGARATVPSAGGLHAGTIVVLPLAVADVARQPHRFDPAAVELRPLAAPMPDKVRAWFRTHHIDYDHAAAIFLIGIGLSQPTRRYGERGYRYALFEAGHIAQNLCLAATTLNLGAVPIGGFDDDSVNEALRESLGENTPIVYAVTAGRVDLPRNDATASRVVRLGRRLARHLGTATSVAPEPTPQSTAPSPHGL